MKKYSNEQLSRILSASAADILGIPGDDAFGSCCIEQAAFSSTALTHYRDSRFDERRYRLWDGRASDSELDASNPDSVLRFLEKCELA